MHISVKKYRQLGMADNIKKQDVPSEFDLIKINI